MGEKPENKLRERLNNILMLSTESPDYEKIEANVMAITQILEDMKVLNTLEVKNA